jgi:hypothetical protein
MQPREIIADYIKSVCDAQPLYDADNIIEALGRHGYEIVSRGWVDVGYQPQTLIVGVLGSNNEVVMQ